MDTMKKDFIELEEVGHGGTYIVNINNITFHTGWHTVFINGVTGNGNSIIKITKESHERLMKMAKERLWEDGK